jgi:hypothetical protein
MDAIWLAVATAAVGWVTKKLLDWLLDYVIDRWRSRGKPLTDEQVRRHHRNRLYIAIANLTVAIGAALLATIATAWTATLANMLVTLGLLALVFYAWRVVRRRWRRRREYEKSRHR